MKYSKVWVSGTDGGHGVVYLRGILILNLVLSM